MSRSPLPAATLLFVDWHDDAFLDAVRAEFADEIASGLVCAHCGDVRTLLDPGRRMAFVSPSNSLLFFDGGYDDALRRMFSGLQQRCQAKLREVGRLTILGRRYLPVGSALVVRTSDSPDTVVVAAPTMFLPHDVSGTRNAYHALMAALMALDGFREGTGAAAFDALVVPAMCCGYGKMPHGESARQMRDALRDFLAARRPTRTGGGDDPDLFMGPLRDDDQPNNFDNREIKDVNLADIRHVGTGRV